MENKAQPNNSHSQPDQSSAERVPQTNADQPSELVLDFLANLNYNATHGDTERAEDNNEL